MSIYTPQYLSKCTLYVEATLYKRHVPTGMIPVRTEPSLSASRNLRRLVSGDGSAKTDLMDLQPDLNISDGTLWLELESSFRIIYDSR